MHSLDSVEFLDVLVIKDGGKCLFLIGLLRRHIKFYMLMSLVHAGMYIVYEGLFILVNMLYVIHIYNISFQIYARAGNYILDSFY